MNRRGFFKAVAGAALVAVPVSKQKEDDDFPSHFPPFIQGERIYWIHYRGRWSCVYEDHRPPQRWYMSKEIST